MMMMMMMIIIIIIIIIVIIIVIHIWELRKWNQMKNDPRSCERNLCNSGLQPHLNPWPRDTGATL